MIIKKHKNAPRHAERSRSIGGVPRQRRGEGVFSTLLIVLSLFITTMSVAQPPPPNPEPMLIGRKGFTSLMGIPDYAWYDENIAKAKKDTSNNKVCAEIAAVKKPYKIVVVGGTWCEDTQNLLPKYYVAMQRAKLDPDKVSELYFVNREKNDPADIVAKYKVTNIPVFIVYNDKGEEVGRITESVTKGIAEDLLEILKKL